MLTERITVRLTEDEYADLMSTCDEYQWTRSQVGRIALRHYLTSLNRRTLGNYEQLQARRALEQAKSEHDSQ